ncbi:hypothetical protein HK096_005349 [Nowakowskiella sp. JEL0078]|nr:hypothetical protein HK096_005349 [Nowakowskiella sp. JEL0078]
MPTWTNTGTEFPKREYASPKGKIRRRGRRGPSGQQRRPGRARSKPRRGGKSRASLSWAEPSRSAAELRRCGTPAVRTTETPAKAPNRFGAPSVVLVSPAVWRKQFATAATGAGRVEC